MSKLECNIVQDLLPSFADGLVNEQTVIEVNEHLSACENCSRLYNEMIHNESFEPEAVEREINYLKKIRKKSKAVIASAFAVLILIIVIAIGLYSFFGVEDEAYSVNDISVTDNDNIMNAEINLFSSARSITKAYTKEADGVVTIYVRSALFSIKKNGSKDIYSISNEYITEIRTSDGRVVWENGEIISQKINDIYNAKAKYIGDNSAVLKLLWKIDINEALKCENFSIRLQTDKKPYGLEIYDIDSYDEMFSAFTNESYEQKIKSCAFIILACIENADYVKFEYIAPDGTEKTYTLTVDEADNYLYLIQNGESIKDLSTDHYSLKLLIDTVGQQLTALSQSEYKPYLIESEEIVDKINNNPIDKKYLDIQNNTPYFSVADENRNYIEWAEAYEKQYGIIYNAILEYAENNPDLEDYIRMPLIEAIRNVENYSEYNDSIADLYYTCEEAAMGIGTNKTSTYCHIYLNEARLKALRLAELAYLLDVDFEWVE